MPIYHCDAVFHWGATIDGDRIRASVLATLELPFFPAVGMQFGLIEDDPPVELSEVFWCHSTKTISISGECELEDWPRWIFDSIPERLKESGYDVVVFVNDNEIANSPDGA